MKLGVCYYPEHWPASRWVDDAKKMADLGLDLVRIGEFAWSRYEPKPGQYQWSWLESSINILHDHGLKVVLGTPTATPPNWLIKKHPEILATASDGNTRNFGSRRHYCFSSPVYHEYSQQIVTAMAKEFGQHPAVVAWQVDNEFGCHNTVRSYSQAACEGFRNWCQQRYGSIEKLNEAWGNVFWSMEYPDFNSIDLPNLSTTEANPSHRLDFYRYSSEQVVKYNVMQCNILRSLSPGRDVLHNYMGYFNHFDHYKLGQALDIATWDSYPLGSLLESAEPQDIKDTYFRTGHPDGTAFNHDLYRGVGKGRMWVMEQQPGPVNWADYNAAPLDGMVRLWAWEAFAHGAEVVSFFRWRQAPFAQEQFHAALNLPDGSNSPVWCEIEQLKKEIDLLQDYDVTVDASVALVFDYESAWALEIVKHGANYNPLSLFLDFYKALRQLSIDVAIISASSDVSAYKCVIVPNLALENGVLVEKLASFNGAVVIGPRSGSKTESLTIPGQLPPGKWQDLIPLRVNKVESLPSSQQLKCEINVTLRTTS